jgi:hypothetical protein
MQRCETIAQSWVVKGGFQGYPADIMRPANRSLEVRCAVPGTLKVHVVDATGNLRKFEHDMTKAIVDALKQGQVPTTASSPVLATDVKSFAAAFDDGDTWNVLLLISHGRAKAGAPDVLRLGDLRTHWFLANAVEMNLNDKAVFLAVCDGACEDAPYVLLRDQLALVLTAPSGKLDATEAQAFFPAVFIELHRLGKQEISPEDIDAAIKRHSSLAAGKMRILSAVGLPE